MFIDMKSPFFITAFPRSRTAWLSNWLTTDSHFCWHDCTFKDDLIGEIPIGISSSEIAPQYGEISLIYPNAPWLLVKRDSVEALASFLKFAERKQLNSKSFYDGIHHFWETRAKLLEELSHQPNVLTVEFFELDSIATAEKVWEHLLPEFAFDERRWKMLNGFNIQQY